jgi:hypothetical protein
MDKYFCIVKTTDPPARYSNKYQYKFMTDRESVSVMILLARQSSPKFENLQRRASQPARAYIANLSKRWEKFLDQNTEYMGLTYKNGGINPRLPWTKAPFRPGHLNRTQQH